MQLLEHLCNAQEHSFAWYSQVFHAKRDLLLDRAAEDLFIRVLQHTTHSEREIMQRKPLCRASMQLNLATQCAFVAVGDESIQAFQ